MHGGGKSDKRELRETDRMNKNASWGSGRRGGAPGKGARVLLVWSVAVTSARGGLGTKCPRPRNPKSPPRQPESPERASCGPCRGPSPSISVAPGTGSISRAPTPRALRLRRATCISKHSSLGRREATQGRRDASGAEGGGRGQLGERAGQSPGVKESTGKLEARLRARASLTTRKCTRLRPEGLKFSKSGRRPGASWSARPRPAVLDGAAHQVPVAEVLRAKSPGRARGTRPWSVAWGESEPGLRSRTWSTREG